MMEKGKQIKITVGKIEVEGWLNETETAGKVWESLPITGSINLWGDEIYFEIPVEAGLENAREVVSLGDIAYWPQGSAMCIFLGKTPVSRGKEIRAVSPVNVIGGIKGVEKLLGKVRQGETINVRR
jgi:hypothetical protein